MTYAAALLNQAVTWKATKELAKVFINNMEAVEPSCDFTFTIAVTYADDGVARALAFNDFPFHSMDALPSVLEPLREETVEGINFPRKIENYFRKFAGAKIQR